MKDLKKLILILLFAFCVISSFMFQNNYASCEDLTFTLNTNGYESGTWTHENVTVEIVYNGTDDVTYQYAINNYENWEEFDGEIEFSQEGIYSVYFSLATEQSISIIQNIIIKLDKTNPTFDYVSVSNFLSTSEDVVITIVASDGLSNVVGYKFGNSNWQELNTYNVTTNTLFEIGSILIKDGAGNVTAYNQVIDITNIDKQEPIFNLITNTTSTIRKDTIVFQLPEILSGIDTFIATMPNGETLDITNSYQNGFVVTQNGEYVFTLKSNSGLTSSVLVIYNNISGNITNFELLIIICVIILIISYSILFAPKIINQIKLNNKKNNYNKMAKRYKI